MSEGRTHVFPQAAIFGSRPLPVPGRGHVLCASAALPFRLDSGEPVKPTEYYEAISAHAGKDAVPDAMAPVPGAELLILGPLPAPGGERRIDVRCGDIVRELRIVPDPDAPDAALALGPEAAQWHEADNPWGRGGPDDEREPLIVLANQPERPVWLGATPFLHPARTKLAGTSAETDSGGWPTDAKESVMFEANAAFWADSLHPGDSLRIRGLDTGEIDTTLPPFRANMASVRLPSEDWIAESVRIHTVAVLPSAGLGAVIWRACIELGKDVLGEKVLALVLALEDLDEPIKDQDALGMIATERWLDSRLALDDRPLLPRSTPTVGAPSAFDAQPFADRHAAAEAWARKETGIGDRNPFGEPEAPKESEALLEKAAESPESMDLDAVAAIGRKALADGNRRHEEAGFGAPDPETQREPVARGETLDAEMQQRLAEPYQSPQEQSIAASLAQAPPEARADAADTLERLASARVTSFEPVLFWPALTPGEGERFGREALEHLCAADPKRHTDISGAVVHGTGDAPARITGRLFDGLLAEETRWCVVEFRDCTFRGTTFARASFERSAFVGCTFERTNFASASLEDVRFEACQLSELVAVGLSCVGLRFEGCALESTTIIDWAVRDTEFVGGSWDKVQVNDSLMVRVAFRGMEMKEVAWTMTHAPYTRFEQVRLFKVWVAALGFPESTFQSVEAETCGFLATARLDGSTFADTRFKHTGFAKAVFKDTKFNAGCAFAQCDFTGAVFLGSHLANVHFVQCTMTMSVWGEAADATGAFFLGSILRGVDFMDTRLVDAVFTDADLEETFIDDTLAVGADFRGTVRS